MAYSVTHDYRYGFVLDDDQLLTLGNELTLRLEEVRSSTPLNYEICWEKSPCCTTENISAAINATHRKNKIEHITISPINPGTVKFKVDFNEGGILLEVNGDDDSPAKLFANNIEEFLENDIRKNRLTWRQVRRASFVLLFEFPSVGCGFYQ